MRIGKHIEIKTRLVVWAWWYIPVISATREAELRRIMFETDTSQKVSETPTSTNKLGMLACIVVPAVGGGIGKRIK
jgi:hypothetical protein